MANRKISELAVRTPSLTDLMLVGDPSTGYSYKATLTSLSTLLEANIALDDLNDVTITSPTAGQVLSYNGTAWVNGTNGITGSGTANYVPKFTSSSAIGNSALQTDNNGNFGIEVTPNGSWSIIRSVLQLNNTSAIFGSSHETILSDNIYVDGSNDTRYLNTAGATYYRQTFGQHYWYSISSGTAGDIINTPSLMFFSNSGSLGIGTLGPTAKLDVIGDLKVSTTATAASFIPSGSSVPTNGMFLPTTNSVGFATNSTERMRLDASGNLLVGGTSVYGATITSYGSATRSGGIGIRNSAGTGAGFFGTYAAGSGGGSTDILVESAGFMAFSGGGSERMRITSGGNVLVATTSASYSAAGRGNVTIGGTSTSIVAFQTNGVSRGYVYHDGTKLALWNDTNGGLEFGTNGTERMRITSGGELLINTTSDAGDYKLQVNGNTYSNGTLTTAAPSGGTAKPFKVGAAATVTPTSQNRTIEIEIDGTTYYLTAKTTND